MYCKNCGKQISEGLSFCPECGKQTGMPAASAASSYIQPQKPKQSKQERYKIRCSKCESENITMETVVEKKRKGFLKILLYLIFIIIALIVTIFAAPVGIVLLLIIAVFALRKKNVTVTYAVCQNCGKRWKVR